MADSRLKEMLIAANYEASGWWNNEPILQIISDYVEETYPELTNETHGLTVADQLFLRATGYLPKESSDIDHNNFGEPWIENSQDHIIWGGCINVGYYFQEHRGRKIKSLRMKYKRNS